MATEVLMPALSPTMEEGTLAKWLVKEGDTVSSGDLLAEIETDKATMEFEAVDEGVIGKLLVAAGTEGVKVNTAIAVLLGLKFKIITGYNSARGQSLALEQGECYVQIASWNSWLVRKPNWIRDRKVIPLSPVSREPEAMLKGVPLTMDLPKAKEALGHK